MFLEVVTACSLSCYAMYTLGCYSKCNDFRVVTNNMFLGLLRLFRKKTWVQSYANLCYSWVVTKPYVPWVVNSCVPWVCKNSHCSTSGCYRTCKPGLFRPCFWVVIALFLGIVHQTHSVRWVVTILYPCVVTLDPGLLRIVPKHSVIRVVHWVVTLCGALEIQGYEVKLLGLSDAIVP